MKWCEGLTKVLVAIEEFAIRRVWADWKSTTNAWEREYTESSEGTAKRVLGTSHPGYITQAKLVRDDSKIAITGCICCGRNFCRGDAPTTWAVGGSPPLEATRRTAPITWRNFAHGVPENGCREFAMETGDSAPFDRGNGVSDSRIRLLQRAPISSLRRRDDFKIESGSDVSTGTMDVDRRPTGFGTENSPTNSVIG